MAVSMALAMAMAVAMPHGHGNGNTMAVARALVAMAMAMAMTIPWQVAMTPFPALANYVSRKTACAAKPAEVYNFLKTSSADNIKQYVESNPAEHIVFHGTLGPNDCLYIPAGWCSLERVAASTDNVGVRILCFGVGHQDALEKTDRVLIAVGWPNEKLQAAMDIILNEGAK